MKTETCRAKLEEALRGERTLRIERAKLDDEPTRGVVRAVGAEWVVLAEERDYVPWGFTALRIADVTDLEGMLEAGDVSARVRALQKRVVPPMPAVDLSDLGALLRSATEAFGLVTIHLEKKLPDVCFVGRAARTTRKKLVLRSITPDGTWEDEPTEYKLAQITCVDFGGPYEAALALLAADDERRAARRKKA